MFLRTKIFLRNSFCIARKAFLTSRKFMAFYSLKEVNEANKIRELSTLLDAQLDPSTLGLKKKVLIDSIDSSVDERCLRVNWSDGSFSRYPYAFLRNNCKCPQCYDPASNQVLFNTIKDLTLDTKAKALTISDDGKFVNCTWQDDHHSTYSLEWLYKMRMPEQKKERNKDSIVKDELFLWNRKLMQEQILRYDYHALMNEDQMLFDFLYNFYQQGIILMENAPLRPDVIMEIAQRFGYHKNTHYGINFEVKETLSPSNLAYTNKQLPLHVDLPSMNNPPNVQVLHCIKQSSGGGDSLFLDGFYVSKNIFLQDARAFELLRSFYVPFVDIGSTLSGISNLDALTVSKLFGSDFLKINKHGRISSFKYNGFVESESKGDCTPDELLEYYDALFVLTSHLKDPKSIIDHRLKPGQIIMFHNDRVLHGRSKLVSPQKKLNERWLQGVYFEWDVIFSKLRSLQEKLGLLTPYLPEQVDEFF
ncbi:gamma-butyrobetaine dioxygenase-like [Xenia sp. Carnegie-2017]|uniref:gamma-butyrobetaine dioxygenase-like n=1 Tax=Xenia sp. Carnegie-2017 TaxID=2897299 RepID=UPI001F047B61|nr:gamma-butyrobetaine dioxygenase-like [Xenia sp. Carnegie-2017]